MLIRADEDTFMHDSALAGVWWEPICPPSTPEEVLSFDDFLQLACTSPWWGHLPPPGSAEGCPPPS